MVILTPKTPIFYDFEKVYQTKKIFQSTICFQKLISVVDLSVKHCKFTVNIWPLIVNGWFNTSFSD